MPPGEPGGGIDNGDAEITAWLVTPRFYGLIVLFISGYIHDPFHRGLHQFIQSAH